MQPSKDHTKHVRAFFRKAQQLQPETRIRQNRDSEVLEAVHTAIESLKLCPNRLWAVTRNLPDGLENIPRGSFRPGKKCDYFREQERVMTNVAFNSHFPSQVLNEAARLGECTAWNFTGQSLVRQPAGYMAISHVWSDGTGTGAWPEKGVNRCLWHFFIRVAKTLQVSGIWWDTASLPRDKTARAKAISRMHRNYEDARVTFVHDCFLREIDWDDSDPRAAAEGASLAIIMSPWFGRGWTALELAKSSKVKIMFRKGKRYILKDLDNDILSASTDQTPAYHIATQAIQNLRRGTITSIDDLLAILGPRSTSWSRDLAVIAALLTGIEFTSTDSQQEIYQTILRKIGRVSHRHLFQNSATMSKGFNWCPANIPNMPFASRPASLLVEDNGNLVGTWKVFQIGSISKRVLAWIGVPPLTGVAIRSALENPNQHVFMVEPDGKDFAGALLVKVLGRHRMFQRLCSRDVGFLPFHPAQNLQAKTTINLEVGLGDTDMIEQADKYVQLPIHLAAERGHVNVVKALMAKSTNINQRSIGDEQTALHIAAWSGSLAVFRLLAAKSALDLMDNRGQTALHIAAALSYLPVVSLLLQRGAKVYAKDERGWTPMAWAARN
ncbi:uncharacterized protein A1O5_09186 [Cladophialophora psammophila CBS 110553]|uniref:Uncharacterized protein n=1 Tax=Cladophialophora psammophila CBS 110553 TaxID=1182543 RepID=W9WS89_9EURO|nr:uncharacterized protein A1O5_09186 [Cladophialophora psammophila CBS 110553]EXJ67840.1 hypothetical protein A1O5_09186 [Cladophialophora psammophila CBS 110553]